MENNNKDWEELEKWSKNDAEKRIEKFGIDTANIDLKEKARNIGIFQKITNIIYKFIKYIMIIFGILVVSAGLLFAYSKFNDLRSTVDVGDIKKNIQNMYDIKLKTISKETDQGGNGKYIFALKDNKEIVFTAFKSAGKSSNDLMDNCLKYYFNKWQSKNKESFKVNEEIKDELLDYSVYIEIETYKNIESSVDKINEFVEFSKKHFYPMWKIYLKKDEMRIYPYTSLNMSKERAIENTKKIYLEYIKNNNIEEDISKESEDK